MSQFKRPFKVTLTDADGVLIDHWELHDAYVKPDGTMTHSAAMYLGCEIADEVDKAAEA